MAILAMTYAGRMRVPQKVREDTLIPTVSRRALTIAAVIGLLALMEAAMLLSVRQESQIMDEAYSLFAGYCPLDGGRLFHLSRISPLGQGCGCIASPGLPATGPADDGRRNLQTFKAAASFSMRIVPTGCYSRHARP